MGGAAESLGINVTNLVFQLMAFGILLFALWKLAYKPVLRILDERAERVKEAMDGAERVKREMAETEQRSRSHMEEARKEAQEVIAQARSASDRMISEARQEAKAEAEKIIERAKSEIGVQKEQAKAELRKEMANLVVMAAGRVVKQSLDTAAHYRLVEDALSQAENLPEQ